MLSRVVDGADEAIAPVIKRVAESRAAGDQFELRLARIEAEVAPREHDRGGRPAGRSDLPAIAGTGAVDLVVESPDQIVDNGLDVELAEAAKNFAAHVGPPI